MKQINKYQQDWDEPINENFSKFANDDFSDNVIYLNGATKDSGFPLWYRCCHVGEVKFFFVNGFIDMPDLQSGQRIDVFNIPAISSKVHHLIYNNAEASQPAFLDFNESANGTFSIKNISTEVIKDWHPRYTMLIVCDND